MTNYTTLGGRIECTQCKAMSKRTRLRCRAPAIKGKAVCRFHGGKSTGAKTAEGRARIAAAHTVHGRETRQKRADTSAKLAELRELEELGFKVGLFAEGTPRTRGRKPKGMSGAAAQLAHLHNLVREERREAILEIVRKRMEGIS
jgi:hypothetical protein